MSLLVIMLVLKKWGRGKGEAPFYSKRPLINEREGSSWKTFMLQPQWKYLIHHWVEVSWGIEYWHSLGASPIDHLFLRKKALLQQSPGGWHLDQVTIIGDITCHGEAVKGISRSVLWRAHNPFMGSLPTNTDEGVSHRTGGLSSWHMLGSSWTEEGCGTRIKWLGRCDI